MIAEPSMMPSSRQLTKQRLVILVSISIRTQIAVVVINEDGDTAIGTVLGEPFLLLDIISNVDALVDVFRFAAVGLFQLFEGNGSLVTWMKQKSQWQWRGDVSVRDKPLGVPNVKSSKPLVAMVPLGRDMSL